MFPAPPAEITVGSTGAAQPGTGAALALGGESRGTAVGIFEAMDMTAAMGAGSETNRETPPFCSAVHCLFLSEEKEEDHLPRQARDKHNI